MPPIYTSFGYENSPELSLITRISSPKYSLVITIILLLVLSVMFASILMLNPVRNSYKVCVL